MTWVLTVAIETTSRSAISVFDTPRAISASTFRSRSVSSSQAARRVHRVSRREAPRR